MFFSIWCIRLTQMLIVLATIACACSYSHCVCVCACVNGASRSTRLNSTPPPCLNGCMSAGSPVSLPPYLSWSESKRQQAFILSHTHEREVRQTTLHSSFSQTHIHVHTYTFHALYSLTLKICGLSKARICQRNQHRMLGVWTVRSLSQHVSMCTEQYRSPV